MADDIAAAARRVADTIRAAQGRDGFPHLRDAEPLLPVLDAVAAGRGDADRVERWAAFLLQIVDDASPEWAAGYIARAKAEPHRGDCPLAEHQGPITCDRCVWEEYSAKARAVIALADAERAADVNAVKVVVARVASEPQAPQVVRYVNAKPPLA